MISENLNVSMLSIVGDVEPPKSINNNSITDTGSVVAQWTMSATCTGCCG